MFGVVLWCDEEDNKAVIWCEDHGDLAFYRNNSDACEIEMDAGDWVQFDMHLDQNQRLAYNPRLVSEGVYPDLADALCSAPAQECRPKSQPQMPQSAPAERNSAQIVPLFAGQSTPARAGRRDRKQTA